MTDAAAVEIRDLEFFYKPDRRILKIDTLSIAAGESVFIHGPSGSGKTTLLGLLTGILTPQSGSLRVLGQDLHRMRPSARDHFRGANIGYIFQMFNLLSYLSVYENIALACRLNPARFKNIGGEVPLRRQAETLMSHLGISELIHRPVTELSVGQQQRVAVARALLGAPKLVIADEPTSALDVDQRENFLKLLFEEVKNAQSTLLFVSHDHTLKPLFQRVVALPQINKAGTS